MAEPLLSFYTCFSFVILGLPIMVMEFSVGRASRKSAALSFDVLEPKGTKWHLYKYGAMAGNYLLMMFYTTIGGWMLLYFFKTALGQFDGLTSAEVSDSFGKLMGQPGLMTLFMIITVVICFLICSLGLQKGVEKITKVMMVCLLGLMIVLAARSLLLKGGEEGIRFYLFPDFKKLTEGSGGLWEAVYAAMGQSFFTLSLGIGALAIFGSYIGKERSLTGEALSIAILDTFVALMAGLIIFPACFAYDIQPDSGPNLIFITLPNVFNAMKGGRLWGTLFFLFMSFAAFSTIIAVFENILSFAMDLTGCSRKKAVVINLIAIIVLSLPCVLGFNVLSGLKLPGGSVLDFEDFLVSNNLLPLGSLIYLLFCTSRYGWDFRNFMKEANTGEGIKFPSWARFYVSYILPVIVLLIFFMGYWSFFH